MEQKNTFSGLHKEGMVFLDALSMQNDPIFFNANKQVFLDHIKAPLEQLCISLAPCIECIDMELDTRSKRTICRIRKDARYSKEIPYRTDMWMSYKPADRSNSDYFTYFFYYDTTHYEVGIGFYGIHRILMQQFRDRIDANPSLFAKVLESIDRKKYDLHGEDYVRRIKKIDLSNPIAQWYNKKSFYVCRRERLDNIAFSPQLIPTIEEVFFDLVPLYDFVMGKKVRFDLIKI